MHRRFAAWWLALVLSAGCGGGSPTGPDPAGGLPPPPAGQPPGPAGPGPIAQIEITPSTVIGGGAVDGRVTLSAASAGTPLTVALSSSHEAARVPASVTFPEGSTSATFRVDTQAVPGETAVTITASVAGHVRTAVIRIVDVRLSALRLRPEEIGGPFSARIDVELNAPAAFEGPPVTVTLSSSDPAVIVPGTVVIPYRQSGITLEVRTQNVMSPVDATISGQAGRETRTATLRVLPNFFAFTGQPGDPASRGASAVLRYDGMTGFRGSYSNGLVSVRAGIWGILLGHAGRPLVPGRYVRSDPNSDVVLQFSGGVTCSGDGEFDVLDAEFDANTIVSFHATFSLKCDVGTAPAPTTGEVWVSTLPPPA